MHSYMIQSIATNHEYSPIPSITDNNAPEIIPTIMPIIALVDSPSDCSSVVGGIGEPVGDAIMEVVIINVVVIRVAVIRVVNILVGVTVVSTTTR